MGNDITKEPLLNEIHVFYDDDADDTDVIRDPTEIPGGVQQFEPDTQNEMLWSYAKDNRIALFMHMRQGSNVESCCNLRDEIPHPPPMPKYEYRNPDNHYCTCLVHDVAANEFKLMGFILFRTYGKTLYILDIVFCYDLESWDHNFPELRFINVPLICISSFNNYVISNGYKCKWRKTLLLNRLFSKKPNKNKPRTYISVRSQTRPIGVGKTRTFSSATMNSPAKSNDIVISNL